MSAPAILFASVRRQTDVWSRHRNDNRTVIQFGFLASKQNICSLQLSRSEPDGPDCRFAMVLSTGPNGRTRDLIGRLRRNISKHPPENLFLEHTSVFSYKLYTTPGEFVAYAPGNATLELLFHQQGIQLRPRLEHLRRTSAISSARNRELET